MINGNPEIYNAISSPVRRIKGKVVAGATTYAYTDALKSFTVERVGESGKFFGFGICQKLNFKLRDIDKSIYFSTGKEVKPYITATEDYLEIFPPFYVTENHRDEKTNELSVTAYDALYKANNIKVSELPAYSSLEEFMYNSAIALGVAHYEIDTDTMSANAFKLDYPNGANFDGTETLREALNAAAEVTQSIYFIKYNGMGEPVLMFKRLGLNNYPFDITIDNYFNLDTKDNRRLAAICSATELGDNVTASKDYSGTTQYVRNNPFWELREDIDILVQMAIDAVGGLTITQFDCSWRGNYLAEIGDMLYLCGKDYTIIGASYLLNDTLTYDGTLSQKSSWQYEDNEAETESNPVTLGDALKQTYAKVDKANKQIELVASEASANTDAIASLQINTEGISASVTEIQKGTKTSLEGMSSDIADLTKKVNAQITAEDVKLSIETELANGTNKVTTNTGFTFNDEGLTVEKSNSEMKTQITEDGMQVFKNDSAVLTANNQGVNALNLHATTYLIIGDNSRFENYGTDQTGCFWIGGNN